MISIDPDAIVIISVSVPVVTALVVFGLHLNNRLVSLEAKVDMLSTLVKDHASK